MKLKSIKDLNLKGKRVFLRADLNVPIKEGKIKDATRIRALLPTLNYIIENGGKPIIASHLGRPKEKDPSLSLKPVAEYLEKLTGRKVHFPGEVVGEKVEKAISEMAEGEILLLENTRFEKGEKTQDPEFLKKLRALADVYVNDAFGTAHRAEATTYGVALLFDERACGFLIEKEVEMLSKLRENPQRPYISILGGAKISDKLEVLEALCEKADVLLIGGGMANTFAKAKGLEIGKSLYEEEMVEKAKEIMEKAKNLGKKIVLPEDFLIAKEKPPLEVKEVSKDGVLSEYYIGDIGSKTLEIFSKELGFGKTIFWNGPLGIFEEEKFSNGTYGLAKKLAEIEAFKLVGGGESVMAIEKAGVSSKITHISTGGGASLEFLGGKELPSLEALKL